MASRRRAYPQPEYNPAVGAVSNTVPPTAPVAGFPAQQFGGQQQPMQQQPFQQQAPFQQQQFSQPQQPQFTNPSMGGVPGATANVYQQPIQTSPYDQLNQGMANMSLNNQQPAAQQQPIYGLNSAVTNPGDAILNELYSTDLLKDLPPPIMDLKFPPPPVNLPSNITASNQQTEFSNVSSDYIRSTLNAVPKSNSLLKKTKLPFALVVHPYTSLTDDEDPVPIVSDGVVVRCRRCRSYLNPYVELRNNNTKWRCNFCSLINDVPAKISTDPNALYNRYELNYAVTEFLATKEYMVRPPQSNNYVFLLDVSKNAIINGMLATTTRTILDSLDRIPNDDGRCNVSFIAVDNKLTYFSIPHDDEPDKENAMLVVTPDDDDEIVLPSPTDLLVNLKQCRNNVEKLLNNLSSYFISNQISQLDLAYGLRASQSLLNKVGGKIVVLSSTMPDIGKGKLVIRDEKSVSGKSKESTALLSSNNSFYKSFAIDCNKSQVTVDMFLTSSSYQDVATLLNLPKFTSGQTHFYPAFNANNLEDIKKFSKELSNHLSMEIGLEAVMRVRCSDGIKGSAFYGNFFSRSSDLLSFPSMPRDQSYVVELAIDNDLRRNVVYFQTAVLHTSSHGTRRIRVMTLALPVVNDIKHVYASADQLAVTKYFTQVSVEKCLNSSFESAREYLQKSMFEILLTYKKEIVAGNIGSTSPLQISTNLRMLPLLVQSLIKNIALRSGNVPSDHRAAAINKLCTLPINEFIEFIYPNVYSLHDMADECGLPYEPKEEEEEEFDIVPKIPGEIILPDSINASISLLQRFGLYLIQTNKEIFVYIGGDAVEQLVVDVFGVSSIYEIPIGKNEIPELDNEFNIRVRNVINKIREGKGSIRYESVYIVVGPSSNERNMMNDASNRDLIALRLWSQSTLVEDRMNDMPAYREFLGQLKDRINV